MQRVGRMRLLFNWGSPTYIYSRLALSNNKKSNRQLMKQIISISVLWCRHARVQAIFTSLT